MEILGIIAAGVIIMGLIWLIVREDPNDKRMREYRAQQFVEGMRKAEARELAQVKTYVAPARKTVDTKPAKVQTSSNRSSGGGSSYSRRDDDIVSSSYSWGGDSSYSSSSSSSSSCDSSSSSSSSSPCD